MYSFMYLPAWRMSQMGAYGTLSRLHALRKVSFFTLFSFAGSSPLPGLWKCAEPCAELVSASFQQMCLLYYKCGYFQRSLRRGTGQPDSGTSDADIGRVALLFPFK